MLYNFGLISNQTRAAISFNFEITLMISDQDTLHSVQLPLCVWCLSTTPSKGMNSKRTRVI